MSFDKTLEIVVPDCSLEELSARLEARLNQGAKLFDYPKTALMGFADREILRHGDHRGKSLLCVEKRFSTLDEIDVDRVDSIFRESGFAPSVQGFMAAAVSGLYSSVSQPMDFEGGGRVVWFIDFRPGAVTMEEEDSTMFTMLQVGDINYRLARGSYLFRGFKLAK